VCVCVCVLLTGYLHERITRILYQLNMFLFHESIYKLM